MRFEFATATRIVFGPGCVGEAAPAIASLGERPLVVTGSPGERATRLTDQVTGQRAPTLILPADGEPTVDVVREHVRRAREAGCDVVVAVGGGSTLDTGKAIAALLANPGDPLDYLEVIGREQPLLRPSAPCIAIPTTAGTGAEVTRNAVLASPAHRVKASLRSASMYPRLALVDPELTYSVPPEVTAATGLDALTQLIEPFVSRAATPITDGCCREGLARVARSLRRAVRDGDDAAARGDMALASLLSGLALANARLGAVHGCAAVLGGLLEAPHGALCARLLPGVMAANLRALEARSTAPEARGRYAEIGRLLTGRGSASAEDGVAWVASFCDALGIPRLSAHGLRPDMIPAVVANAQQASSTKGNPIPLTDEELTRVLEEAL